MREFAVLIFQAIRLNESDIDIFIILSDINKYLGQTFKKLD